MQDVSKYEKKTPREHVLLRTEMYVGSLNETNIDGYFYTTEGDKPMMVKKTLPYIEGLVKIVNEVIDNAVDNMNRDPPTTVIKVEISGNYIKVINNGKHIPIVQKDHGDGEIRWIPSVIFGDCLSGSNFSEDEDRDSIGMNGLGVKLANILSSEFMVELFDPVEQKFFTQIWCNNMSVIDDPRIISRKKPKKDEITKVSMKPQMKLFNKELIKEGGKPKVKSVEDIKEFIVTRLASISACHPRKVKIFFNDKLVSIDNFQKFIKLHTTSKFIYEKSTDNFEYGVTVSPSGTFEHQSFVNCLSTPSDKSTHTRYVTNFIIGLISAYLEKKMKNTTGGIKLDRNTIKNKIMVFVNIRLKNPVFTSQTKVELSSPISKTEYPLNSKRIMNLMKSSGILDSLEEELQKKAWITVRKEMNASKTRKLVIDKLDDAHNAGTSDSDKTMLFLVEGDSAKTFVSTGLSIIKRENYGVFPLKGKILNVRDMNPSDLISQTKKESKEKKNKNNSEITNIMKILGLSFDKKYDTESELKTLRYGKLCILTDADVDGKGHIAGLLISFIDYFWPSLLSKHKFLFRFDTPIIKGISNRKSHPDRFFYTLDEFNDFKDSDDAKHFTMQHLKGLGTSERKDILTYFKQIKDNTKSFVYDESSRFYLEHIFGKDYADWRKNWITNPSVVTTTITRQQPEIPISDFLNTDMHEYSVYSLRRSIPSLMDGMKTSQRKILYACMKKFNSNGNKRVKVAQLSAYVASITNYAHGEDSLNKAIVGMGQDFAGSNNMNILQPLGSFGSRIQRGKDAAAPRYLFTCLSDHAKKLFNKSDDDVLDYQEEEGYKVEPKFYVPQLPIVLINGTLGLATGFRSTIPCFNPDDVRKKIIDKIHGRENDENLKPWFNGFKTNDKTFITKDNKWHIEGDYDFVSSYKLIITEVPINMSIEQYETSVLKKLQENKVIRDFDKDHVDENSPRFTVNTLRPFKKEDHDEIMKVFKLTSTIPMTCFNLLDENEHVVTFRSVDEIISHWFRIKMEYIQKRKDSQLDHLNHNLRLFEQKRLFILSVVNGDLELRKVSEDDIVKFMESNLKIDQEFHQLFLKIPVSKFSKDNVMKLEKQIQETKKSIELLENKSLNEIYLDDLNVTNGKRKFELDESEIKKSKYI